jgi:hypothetical protein
MGGLVRPIARPWAMRHPFSGNGERAEVPPTPTDASKRALLASQVREWAWSAAGHSTRGSGVCLENRDRLPWLIAA